MTIVFFSDAIFTLNKNELFTSSQKYELSIAEALAENNNVLIYSKKIDKNVNSKKNNLLLSGFSKDNIKCIKKNSEIKNIVIIFYGYDLKKVLFMLWIKIRTGCSSIPFIYDTHKIAISHYNIIKKILAEMYFSLGRFLIRYFDGAILFQDKAAQLLKINKPYHVSKPGIVPKQKMEEKQKDDSFNVVFAGSLTELNGIIVFLETAKILNKSDMHFCIYGSGPLTDKVQQAVRQNFVEYGGTITDNQLQEVYSRASVIVNLRNPNDEAMAYAFPSKLIEIMDTGIPIVSTKIIRDGKFENVVYAVDELTPQELSKALTEIKYNYEYYREKAQRAKEYVESNYNSEKLSKAIYEYLKGRC